MRDDDAKVYHLSRRDFYTLIQDFNDWCKKNGRLFTPGTRIQEDIRHWLEDGGPDDFIETAPTVVSHCVTCGKDLTTDAPFYAVAVSVGYHHLCALCAIEEPGAERAHIAPIDALADEARDDDADEIPF